MRRREGGGILSGVGCIWSQGAFIFPTQCVVVIHQSLSAVETAYRAMATNKQGWELDTEFICSSIISLISVTWLCAEHGGSGLSALYKAEVWLSWSCGGGMEGCEGKMSFMLSAVAVVSLGDRQLLLPLQTPFSTTVSRMILSDCFSIWAMKNTRAGIHLQSVLSFFSSGNENELVLSCHAHMHSSGTAKQNHVLTKGSPWSASCWKEGCPLSSPAVWWAVCLTAPSRGKNLKYYSGVSLHRDTSAPLLLTCWCLVTSSRFLFWWLQKTQIEWGLQILPGGVRVKKIWGFLAVFPSPCFFCIYLILLAYPWMFGNIFSH